MSTSKSITAFLFILFPLIVNAQLITGIGTRWSDAFTEWIIYTDNEELEGDLTLRWQLQGDWSEWDYRLGEEVGSIKMKWKDNPSQWELRGGNEIVTIYMVWPNDVREWRLTDNSTTLTLKSRWGNNRNEWQLKTEKYGHFDIIANWENDPREWNVWDELDEDISIHMKIALLFIATFHSSPKG
jgi:hypothetical protein